MLIARVVDDEIEQEFHPPQMQFLDEALDIGNRTIWGVDGLVIGDVVPHVHLWISNDRWCELPT